MYDHHLAERIRMALKQKGTTYSEKEMMGGLAFMVKDKMCVGITDHNLMARIDPDLYEEALKKNGCRPMEFTGRPMRGWIYVDPEGIDIDDDLNYWIQLALDFNPKAKSSKKKR